MEDLEVAILSEYIWSEIQAALIEILLDDQYTNLEYEKVANGMW